MCLCEEAYELILIRVHDINTLLRLVLILHLDGQWNYYRLFLHVFSVNIRYVLWKHIHPRKGWQML